MAMTRAQWEALQRRLPAEDRTSYEEYLRSQGQFAPTPSRTAMEESGTIGAASIARQMSPQIAQAISQMPSPAAALPNQNPPSTGLKAGYEWYKFNLPGGGFEWRQRPSRETLTGAYTQMFGGAQQQPVATQTPTATQTATSTPTTTPTGLTAKQLASQSAFEIFRGFLRQYGIEGLAADVEKYKLEGLSDEELLIRLRTESTAYKNRFKANEARIAKGLAALSEAEYIGVEDQYQEIMRRYGLPESYYARGEMGRQEGFEKLIANDVSNEELEDRILTAQNRIQNAPTQIKDALSQFYGAEISNGDVLAYMLDPDRALPQIKRKITAAEIGGAAAMAGLAAGRTRAEELETYGVTGAAAREGFQTIAGVLPRATMLSDIYAKQGVGPYTQTTAEQEVFGLPSAAEATRRRQKLSELEQAQFAGSSGMAGGALSRERAGSI